MTLLPPEGERFSHGYCAVPLTRSVAQLHGHTITRLHRAIPYVTLTRQDLLADGSDSRVFSRKFDLSTVVFDEGGEVAGFMLAYEREREALHPLRSVYLHRMAIHPAHRNNGVARSLVQTYINHVPDWDPSINNLTLQTNYQESNRWVIAFYERMGFVGVTMIPYPQKLDILMIRAL